MSNQVTSKIGISFALIISSFYFLIVEYTIEMVILMTIQLSKTSIILIPFALFIAAIVLAVVFLLFYVARYIEEKTGRELNKSLKIIFYYTLPILLYLVLKGQIDYTLPFIVIVISFIVRMTMEKLFIKIYKKSKNASK